MVDAHVSGACVERHAGSSPVLGTILEAVSYTHLAVYKRQAYSPSGGRSGTLFMDGNVPFHFFAYPAV